MDCDVVVGMQWGSEGKGKVAGLLADRYDAAVRAGGPNAGHTIVVNGTPRVVRHLPSAVVNRNCRLYAGAGAAIDPLVLKKELDEWADFDAAARLVIDRGAVLVTGDHRARETADAGWMGSTCKGGGEAWRDKMRRAQVESPLELWPGRNGDFVRFDRWTVRVGDVRATLEQHLHVLVEGTQGALLSLDHGDWPWVTTRNVTTAGVLSDVGLSPRDVRRVYGVLRTFPIRVGGPSGPLPGEITWDELAAEIGKPGLAEYTTVTGRRRRIARIDWSLLRKAQQLNGASHLAVTFLDYLKPESRGTFMLRVQQETGAPVVIGSEGPGPRDGWMMEPAVADRTAAAGV